MWNDKVKVPFIYTVGAYGVKLLGFVRTGDHCMVEM